MPHPNWAIRSPSNCFREDGHSPHSFAYNDVAAIGAIHAFQEAGLRVPEDVSVVGFDDIRIAAYNNPSLTTVRQPLQRMGEIAACTLLNRIEHHENGPELIEVEPEFVVRNSTARVPTLSVAGIS